MAPEYRANSDGMGVSLDRSDSLGALMVQLGLVKPAIFYQGNRLGSRSSISRRRTKEEWPLGTATQWEELGGLGTQVFVGTDALLIPLSGTRSSIRSFAAISGRCLAPSTTRSASSRRTTI